MLGVSLLASVTLLGGVAEGTQKPKLTAAVIPAPVHGKLKLGTNFDLQASGYSGSFDSVALFLSAQPCAKTALAQYNRGGSTPYTFAVSANATFSVRTHKAYTARQAGDRYACAYLFKHNHAGATSQLHASTHFTNVK